jgi:all-trans-nonaprenyl-diphosphate synthase
LLLRMMSMTCHNLDFGRAKLDLVACGCSSNASIDRYSVRNYAKSVSKSCNRDYGSRRLVCSRRDIARCRVSPTKTPETLPAGTFLMAKAPLSFSLCNLDFLFC